MARFLTSDLSRLAGPFTPITYLRSAEYQELYTDYSRIGRLVLLRPTEVNLWHSGLNHVYIAPARQMPAEDSLGFIPGEMTLPQAAVLLNGVRSRLELREVFGGRPYDELRAENLARIVAVNEDCRNAETLAHPLRMLLQKGDAVIKGQLREQLSICGLSESDLCAAWHHLPLERREHLKDALPRITSHFGSPLLSYGTTC
jgi:hypothetical protein